QSSRSEPSWIKAGGGSDRTESSDPLRVYRSDECRPAPRGTRRQCVLQFLTTCANWEAAFLLRCGCHRHGSILWRAQVAGDFVLVDGPDYHLIKHVITAGIELYGLAGVLVFLFDGAVVSRHVERVLALLRIGLLELQRDRRNGLGLRTLQQREFIILTIAFVL